MYSSRRAPCINDNASAEQESRVSCVWSRDVKQPPVSRRSAADITLYSYLYTIFFFLLRTFGPEIDTGVPESGGGASRLRLLITWTYV